MNSIWIRYDITMKPLWNQYEFTSGFAISLWNHYLSPKITIDSLYFSRNQYEFTICFAISLFIDCLFREVTLNPWSFLWINDEYAMKSIWIHFLLRGFSLNSLFANSLSVSRSHLESTLFFFRNHYEYAIISLWNHYEIVPLSVPRIHRESTIYFVISLWIHYLFCDFSMDLLYISEIYFKYSVCYANFLWIHYLFTLSISWIYFKFTFYFAISFLNHYLFRLFTMKSLFISCIHFTSKIIFFGLLQLLFPRINSEFIIFFSRTQFESALVLANLLRIITHTRNHDSILT